MRNLMVLAILVVIAYILLLAVAEMPTFGDPQAPVHNQVSQRFLAQGAEETGAVNLVTAIITDYRAFDTLGETTVLFAAIAAVLSVLGRHKALWSKRR